MALPIEVKEAPLRLVFYVTDRDESHPYNSWQEESKGTIEVKNEVAGGSHFTVRFPTHRGKDKQKV